MEYVTNKYKDQFLDENNRHGRYLFRKHKIQQSEKQVQMVLESWDQPKGIQRGGKEKKEVSSAEAVRTACRGCQKINYFEIKEKFR